MNKLLVCLILILSGYLGYFYIHNFVSPQTRIGETSISGLPNPKAVKIANNMVNKPLRIKISNHVYTLQYEDIGIEVNEKKFIQDVRDLNKSNFFENVIQLVKSFREEQIILPEITFTQDFYANSKEIFRIQNGQDILQVDTENLRASILLNFGQDVTIEPDLIAAKDIGPSNMVPSDQYVGYIYQDPVKVTIPRSKGVTQITLTEQEVKEMIDINYVPGQEYVMISFDNNAFQTAMNPHLEQLKGTDFSVLSLRNDMESLINNRVLGANSDTIIAKLEHKPKTKGGLAPKYIEIDLNQKQIFLFENGQLKKNLPILSPDGTYIPNGEFKVLQKGQEVYSKKKNIFLPLWIAFYEDKNNKTFVGMHEMPYYLEEEGEIIKPKSDHINVFYNKGISMKPNVAKEVYEFSEVGTPVYVFK